MRFMHIEKMCEKTKKNPGNKHFSAIFGVFKYCC